jgi:hypothetical protein
VTDGLDDITSSSLAFSSYHCSTFTNAAECFAQISATTNERNRKGVLFNMMSMIGRGENLGFIYVINANGFKDLQALSAKGLV